MVQDQLVDYVSSQLKLGVSRDAIKAALVSAGWVAVDVDDTLKKVTGSSTAATTSPAGSVVSTTTSTSSTSTKPAGAGMKTDPQTIRVSDLVSASPAMTATTTTVSTATTSKPTAATSSSPAASFNGKISGNTFQASGHEARSKKGIILGVIAVLLILGFAGAAWYFYSANADLSGQVTTLTSQAASVNSQLTALQSQMNASSTGLSAQIASLTAANTDLALDLSFYAVPVSNGTTSAPTTTSLTISGWLTSVKNVYWITTPRGAKISIANASDPKISGSLKSYLGDTVQAVGTYVPGSDQMTVTSLTNLSPAPAAPQQASSTTSTVTMAPASGGTVASSTATTTGQ